MKYRYTSIPAYAAVLILLTSLQFMSTGVQAQATSTSFKLPIPAGFTTEEFPLPPDFAPTFTFKGVEEIRFHPGWGDSTSKGYWSYTYLWWLEGTPAINETALTSNLKAYYDGLVGRNITSRKIPAEKVVPTVVSIKKARSKGNDKATFTGTVSMLDYMTQRPMVLHAVIHVKDAGKSGKTAVIIEVSPQQTGGDVWKQLDEVPDGFSLQ